MQSTACASQPEVQQAFLISHTVQLLVQASMHVKGRQPSACFLPEHITAAASLQPTGRIIAPVQYRRLSIGVLCVVPVRSSLAGPAGARQGAPSRAVEDAGAGCRSRARRCNSHLQARTDSAESRLHSWMHMSAWPATA